MDAEAREILAQHLPSRLDEEPLILKGLSHSELVLVIQVWTVIGLAVALTFGALTGLWVMIFGVWPLAIFFGTLGTAVIARTIKRNRPSGYFLHRIQLGLYRVGLAKRLPFVYRQGLWLMERAR